MPSLIHPLLARELRQSKRLQKFFDSLPDSSRHQIDREVREVKKEETRLRRAQHARDFGSRLRRREPSSSEAPQGRLYCTRKCVGE